MSSVSGGKLPENYLYLSTLIDIDQRIGVSDSDFLGAANVLGEGCHPHAKNKGVIVCILYIII